jgi:hypothetical protein
MRIKLGEEVTLFQDGSTETRDVKLKHILFAHVNYHFLHGDDDMSCFSTDTDRNPSHLLTKLIKIYQGLTRWGQILQAYNLIIKHTKGKDNVIAYDLRRIGNEFVQR